MKIPIVKLNHRIRMPDSVTYEKLKYLYENYGMRFNIDFKKGKAYAIIEELINLNEKDRKIN